MEYESTKTKQHVPVEQMGAGCECILFKSHTANMKWCNFYKLTQLDKENLFIGFYKLFELNIKNAFLFGLIKITHVNVYSFLRKLKKVCN